MHTPGSLGVVLVFKQNKKQVCTGNSIHARILYIAS